VEPKAVRSDNCLGYCRVFLPTPPTPNLALWKVWGLWRSKVQSQFHWIKVKMSAELAPSGGSEGRIYFLTIFSASHGYLHSLVGGSLLHSSRLNTSVSVSVTIWPSIFCH
jgi:hypothetical protein